MTSEGATGQSNRVTVNLSAPTYRMVRSFRGLVEFVSGKACSLDEAILIAVSYVNFEAAKESGLTKERELDKWLEANAATVKGPLRAEEIEAVTEGVEALGLR